ncbi:hypothetical protein Rhe02_21180 [Rhizocola hellebori]|uniref:DUF885 domain-containing protein n=1 Tax=Rhizocola hellebori TaxID=1392758 RepID=A0A8J3Q5D0_9ACTN|nr:DUF885 domain-containing protein [Rhizocola hellebori]GIH04051.1 hypothetical protein Rhe02_21180 [Rhizocola hellebori]
MTPIFALCDTYVRRSCELNPAAATYQGVPGDFAPGTDFSPDGYAARAALQRTTLATLATLLPHGRADQLAAAHLRERLEAELAWYDSGEALRPLRTPFGLLQALRDNVDLMPAQNEQDWSGVLARVQATPGMLAGLRASLAEGAAQGVVAARRQAVEGAAQAQRYADKAGFRAVAERYGSGPLAAELAVAVDRAHAAFAETARFLREEYAHKAAEADGVGPDRYAVSARLALGADLDLVDAYHWGWAELHQIEDQMSVEAGRVLPGAGIEQAMAHLNATEYVDDTDAYRAWLRDRHDEAIERLHGVHFDIAEPLRTVDINVLLHSSAGAPYYTPPSEDLKRPGRTWWPASGRERFGIWAELTTVFHEGVPGHHLQLGQTRVTGQTLSRFSRLTGISGHGEGWALYAENLADELGFFQTPGQRLGMLKASALRAARVVCDIGLHLDLPLPAQEAARHSPRWSFATMVEVLRDRGRLAEHRVHAEAVRYCGWPAQAISYKLGQRAWLAARDEARQRLGSRFDLKQWHTEALSLGPVGLATLAQTLRTM